MSTIVGLRSVFARIAIVAIAPMSLAGAIAAQTIDTLAIREHTRVLASDSLEGRNAGSRGERIAAQYIADQARALGLRPIAGDFMLPVPLQRIHIQPESRITIRRGTRAADFRYGEDFIMAAGGRNAFRDFSGPAVFLGGADHVTPGSAPDSLLRGRVIVLIGSLGGRAATLVPRWRDAGAAAVLLGIPGADDVANLSHALGPVRFTLDGHIDDPVWQPDLPIAFVGPDILRALLAGSVPQSALDDRPVDPIPLDHSVAARIVRRFEPAPTSNVAAVLPGSDPALRNQYVVFTAHYDHLGIDPAAGRDSIYNGFSDNAAGVAMLLAIADAMRTSPPARSVLFLFLAAEERGLLGSTWYATRPAVPLAQTVAVINLDAGAPPVPPISWRIAGDSTIVGALAKGVARERGWNLVFSAASPNTDYWPFHVRGVPAIFIVPGNEWEGTTPEQHAVLTRRWDRYHAPNDEWSPDFPFAGLQRYATFALEIGRAAASPAFSGSR